MTKAKITFVMESELKQQFAEACANIGMSMNRALNTLVRKTLRADPNLYELDYDEPNAETLAALKETEEILADPSKAKFYDNVEDLMRDLRAEVAH